MFKNGFKCRDVQCDEKNKIGGSIVKESSRPGWDKSAVAVGFIQEYDDEGRMVFRQSVMMNGSWRLLALCVPDT